MRFMSITKWLKFFIISILLMSLFYANSTLHATNEIKEGDIIQSKIVSGKGYKRIVFDLKSVDEKKYKIETIIAEKDGKEIYNYDKAENTLFYEVSDPSTYVFKIKYIELVSNEEKERQQQIVVAAYADKNVQVRENKNQTYRSISAENDSHTVLKTIAALNPDTVINIPDPKFKAIINRNLHGDLTGKYDTQDITISQMKSLTNIYRSNIGGIQSIEGIQYAENLKYLQLYSQNISNIGQLSQLSKLNNINFYNNKISDISPLKGLTLLTTVRLDANQISDVSPLKGLTNLTNLNLVNQNIDKSNPSIKSIGDVVEATNVIKDLDGSLIVPTSSPNYYNSGDKVVFKNISSDGNKNYTFNKTVTVGTANTTFSGTVTYHVIYDPIVSIPDPKFRAMLNRNIHPNSEGNPNTSGEYDADTITLSSIKSLRKILRADVSGIQRIEGIQYARNLEWIELSNEEINDLKPLANLVEIKTLYLDSNKISDISSLKNLTSLTNLTLHEQTIDKTNPPIITIGDMAEVTNTIKDVDNHLIAPSHSDDYDYDFEDKVVFKNISSDGDKNYYFSKIVKLGSATATFSGTVTYKMIFSGLLNYIAIPKTIEMKNTGVDSISATGDVYFINSGLDKKFTVKVDEQFELKNTIDDSSIVKVTSSSLGGSISADGKLLAGVLSMKNIKTNPLTITFTANRDNVNKQKGKWKGDVNFYFELQR